MAKGCSRAVFTLASWDLDSTLGKQSGPGDGDVLRLDFGFQSGKAHLMGGCSLPKERGNSCPRGFWALCSLSGGECPFSGHRSSPVCHKSQVLSSLHPPLEGVPLPVPCIQEWLSARIKGLVKLQGLHGGAFLPV